MAEMAEHRDFQQEIQSAYRALLNEHQVSVPKRDRIRIDLHCHDFNSDVTDELLGRILRFPETWLRSEDLVSCLKQNGCNAVTVTNHNNARSCWQLLEKGEDILSGAEFSCRFRAFSAHLHVLAYGFTPSQEEILNRKRHDLISFLSYAADQDIPTLLPHPLYFDARKKTPDPRMYEQLFLMFDRFEVLNGQRDTWQNLLTWEWLNRVTEDQVRTWEKAHGINSGDFCRHIYTKQVTGGSDDHMGLFAGSCGTFLHVPDLKTRLKNTPASQLALEALRSGELHPYGSVADHEKLNIAFIDYLSQIALNMKEPGLLRMFLHKGTLRDKLICLGFSNVMQELRRHRFTMFFFKILHEALQGKRPGLISRFKVSSDFKPLIREIDRIAKAKNRNQAQYLHLLRNGTAEIYADLNKIIARRIKTQTSQFIKLDLSKGIDTETLIHKFEIPTHLRALFQGDGEKNGDHLSQVNVSEFFDTLSFPVLASGILAGASLISTRVLNNQREFVNGFARSIGKYVRPRRVLWLTDTLRDQNGVSNSLSRKLAFIRSRNIAIDFLICHPEIDAEPHLRVTRPVGSFNVPSYPGQTIHVPDLLAVKKSFIDGGYDRIVCSTELMMGVAALFLKQSMAVPVYFYMHTDWLEFFKRTTDFGPQVIDRIRRILRAFYRQFDGIFVMNQDHRNWLTGPAIQYPGDRVYESANWVDERFYPRPVRREKHFGAQVTRDDIVILYAGRLSTEKGVFDLPPIMDALAEDGIKAKLIIAGEGPARERLQTLLPQALFLGWVDKQGMPDLYSQVDLLVLPSRFDTFGNVILEAMSCGAAVAAYAEKGPKNIIQGPQNGILARDLDALTAGIKRFARDRAFRARLKAGSLQRARAYSPDIIFDAFLRDLKMSDAADAMGSGNPDISLKTASGY